MRSKELLKKRDHDIVCKFHELYDLKRMRMDDVLKIMSEQHFYLDTNYIYACIFYNTDNNEHYNSLLEKKDKTTTQR
ncbi:MAG: hypothetical protein WCG93_13420 [Paludibacter sp.]